MGWNTKPKQQSFWTKPQHALNIYGQTPTDKLTKLPSVVGAPKPQMQRLGLGGTVYPSNQPGFGKVFEGYMPAQPSAPPKVPMAPVKQFALGPASSFEKNFGYAGGFQPMLGGNPWTPAAPPSSPSAPAPATSATLPQRAVPQFPTRIAPTQPVSQSPAHSGNNGSFMESNMGKPGVLLTHPATGGEYQYGIGPNGEKLSDGAARQQHVNVLAANGKQPSDVGYGGYSPWKDFLATGFKPEWPNAVPVLRGGWNKWPEPQPQPGFNLGLYAQPTEAAQGASSGLTGPAGLALYAKRRGGSPIEPLPPSESQQAPEALPPTTDFTPALPTTVSGARNTLRNGSIGGSSGGMVPGAIGRMAELLKTGGLTPDRGYGYNSPETLEFYKQKVRRAEEEKARLRQPVAPPSEVALQPSPPEPSQAAPVAPPTAPARSLGTYPVQDPNKEFEYWKRGPNGEWLRPQQSAPSPVAAPRPAPAGNPYAGMTPDETVNAMRRELTTNPLDALRAQAAQAGNDRFDTEHASREAERRRAARLGGNTGPEDAAKAIGPGLDNSAWYLRNPDGTPTVNGTQAPRGDIAQSRFQGAMTFQNPATGRANFIDPSPSGGLDVAGYRRAMEKINQPVDENLKPMYPRSALPIAQGQGEQQPTLPVSYRTGEETGLTPTPRSPIAPPAGRPGLTMMPTSPVGALAAYGASSPQGVDNLKRMAYRENRQQELQARKDRRFQLAQGEAQARRDRLANRGAPSNPLMAMAMQNPELALGLAELNQRGQLGALQAQLAQQRLAQEGELGRGGLEVERDRNKGYLTGQESERELREKIAGMEQSGREKALELEQQNMQTKLQAQGLGAALEAGVISPEEFQQGIAAISGGNGLGVYQPPSGNSAPGSRLTPSDRKEMAAMDHPTMRKFLIAKGITNPQERLAVMQEFFPDEKGLTDSQVGYNLGELGAELYPPYGIYTQIRKQIDPSFRTAWGRFNEDRKKRSAKGE